MNPVWTGKGRDLQTEENPFPFLLGRLPIHPAGFLFAHFSLVIFSLSASCCRWLLAILLWGGLLLLAILNAPPSLHALKKMRYVLPFLGVSLFFHLFFTPGTLFFRIGPLLATREGLSQGWWITQKLAFFFSVSFVLVAGIPSSFLFQVAARLRHFSLLNHLRITSGLLILFLILRWLRILPQSWKKQLQEPACLSEDKYANLMRGLKMLPRLIRRDITDLDGWITLFVSRGYAEGVLWVADAPFVSFNRKDLMVILATLVAWGFWIPFRF